MADLLLLGIIPGTRIEITFDIWLLMFEVICFVLFVTYVLFDRRTFQAARFVVSIYTSAWRAKRRAQLA